MHINTAMHGKLLCAEIRGQRNQRGLSLTLLMFADGPPIISIGDHWGRVT